MPNFTLQQWKQLLLGIVVVDLLIVAGILYIFYRPFQGNDPVSIAQAKVVTATATITPTPWAGPGPRPTARATLPPTPVATDVLAESGFPPGFTPTPRPTRESLDLVLQTIFMARGRAVDVPVINQVYYPEPFFQPGTNNACGPIALFAGLQGLGAKVGYSRVRDIAVSYGFGAEGISTSGMVNTIRALNYELGNPYAIEYGNHYTVGDLMKQLRQRAVVIVLVRVKREQGQFQITADPNGSFGHFLVIERINLRTKKIKLAGSTLGMDQVPLSDFTSSWANSPQTGSSNRVRWPFGASLKQEKFVNWALIFKRS